MGMAESYPNSDEDFITYSGGKKEPIVMGEETEGAFHLGAVVRLIWDSVWEEFYYCVIYWPCALGRCVKASLWLCRNIKLFDKLGIWSGYMDEGRGEHWNRKSRYGEK